MANVRKRSPQEMASTPQSSYNKLSEYVSWAAKTGNEAKLQAEVVEAENRESKRTGKKPEVKKVNSNPVPGRTRVGNLSGKARGGGLGGGGGLLPENR